MTTASSTAFRNGSDTQPLLLIDGLTVMIGEQTILNEVSLQISPGERIGVLGASGSGKSMTAAAVVGLLPGNAKLEAGAITYRAGTGEPASDLANATEKEFRTIRGRGIGLIFQEPHSTLNPSQTAGAQLREAVLHLRGNPERTVVSAVTRQLLEEVRLAQDAERILSAYPHELSGGQRQRLLIAIALAGRPQLLIADEPTTALDPETECAILDLLDTVITQRGMSLLLITHDRRILRDRTDRVYEFAEGRVVRSGATKVLLKPGSRKSSRRSDLLRTPAAAVLQIHDLHFGYPAKRWWGPRKRPAVLSGLHLSVYRHEWVAIVGRSGIGKSTLARLLTVSPYRPDGGRITLRDDRKPQLIAQDPAGTLNPRHTVRFALDEVLRYAPTVRRLEAAGTPEQLLRLVALNPESYLGRYPHELSGGEKQRVAIARALAADPSLLIADEAVAALDAPLAAEILELFAGLLGRYPIGLLFITHDLDVCRSYADRTFTLQAGKLIAVTG